MKTAGVNLSTINVSAIFNPKFLPKYRWLPDPPDARDHLYQLHPVTLAPVVDLRQYASAIEDQGNLGSCTGNAATATTASTANALNTGNNYQVNSFGVGTAASGTAGEIRATNNVTAYYSSDINLKTNIKPLENSLDKILKLNGVSFEWKKESDARDLTGIKDDLGFIAQEVQEILPELVRKNDNGLLSLRDKGIIPILVEAIKEQQRQIDDLKYLLQTQTK